MDALEKLIEFSRETGFDDLPADVVVRTKLAVLDTLGCAIAGAVGPGIDKLHALVADWGGKPEATLVTGTKGPMPLAALVNASAGRAWDLDDVHDQATCHINVSTVPAALAAAEARGRSSGREFIAAVAVGSEVVCRTALAPRLSFSETGMSMTYQCGTFGAAVAAARALGLDRRQTEDAFGIAYARLAGNQRGFLDGADTVRLMQGVACEGGVIAALMAERGLSGSRDVLEGRFGYYRAFQRGAWEPSELTDGLGRDWRLLEVSVKPGYACCKFNHGPIEATIGAMTRLGLAPDAIERIEVRVTNKEVYDLVCEPRARKVNPTTIADAQFSLPYAVASAAVTGGFTLASLAPSAIADPAVRALMARIEPILDAAAQGDSRGSFPMPGIVRVRARSGEVAEARVEHVKGHPENPMAFEEVAAKFRDCAAFAAPAWDGADRLIEAVGRLETLDSAAPLAAFPKATAPEPRQSIA